MAQAEITGGEGARKISAAAREARRHLDVGGDLVLRDLADLFREGEKSIFDSQGVSFGARWAPLADSTKKSRGRMASKFGLQIRPSSPILVNFGDLRDAFTVKGGAHHQRIGRTDLRISIDEGAINRHNRKKGLGMALTKSGQRRRKPKGKGSRYPEDIIAIHDEGKGRAPKRKIIGTPYDQRHAMDKRFRRYIEGVVRTLAADAAGASANESMGNWEGWGD